MRELASNQVPVEINIFERANHVGGRAKLAHVDDKLVDDFEVRASTFSKEDRLRMSMMEVFGLEEATQDQSKMNIGVWNGTEAGSYLPAMAIPCLVESCKVLLEVWTCPFRTQTLAKKVIAELRANYEIDDFSLKLHSNTAPHANIERAISTTAEAYLEKHNIRPPYSTEIIQACTRKCYAQDLSTLHGLAAMMAMNTENTTSVKGENWRLFDEVVKLLRHI